MTVSPTASRTGDHQNRQRSDGVAEGVDGEGAAAAARAVSGCERL